MRRTKAGAVLLVAALLAGGGCASGELLGPGGPQEGVAAGGELPLVRLRAEPYPFTFYSGLDDSTRVVVRDADAWAGIWARIWERHEPVPPLPEVDFGREMVVVVGLGTRPTGGYGILLERAVRREGAIEVTVRKESPGAACGLTQALTQPVDVALLPRSDHPVRFRETRVVRDCG